MKKRLGLVVCLLLTLLCVTALADVAINETNFPDENFRAYVQENCDKDGDGTLSDSEIAGVTSIDCTGKSVSSLKGTYQIIIKCTKTLTLHYPISSSIGTNDRNIIFS